MTFEDMMKMKRLGETAVSADGKWLAYSVTTVNLEQNTKTTELFVQAIAASSGTGSEAMPLAVSKQGDSGVQFAPDGRSVLFLSGREQGQQIWLADFDGATGTASNARKLTSISTEADNAKWALDSKSIVFTSDVYPDCPAIGPADGGAGDKCNADRDASAASSKVKAQIFTHLLYRHWDHFTGPKRSHLFLVAVDSGAVRDLTPNDTHDVPPFSMEGGGGFDISPDSKELAFTENLDAEPATSVSASIFTLDLTRPAAKPVKVSTSAGGNFSPAYSPDGKWLAWRSQERAGYESDKFRLVFYDRKAKTIEELMRQAWWAVDEFAWAHDSKHVYYAADINGYDDIRRFTLDKMGVEGVSMLPVYGPTVEALFNGEFSDLHPLPNAPEILASWTTIGSPGEVITQSFDLSAPPPPVKAPYRSIITLQDGGSLRENKMPSGRMYSQIVQITHLNNDLLDQLDLTWPYPFSFKASDGTEVHGFMLPPPGFDHTKKYPLKFLIHGGPQGAWGDMWSYRWNAELLAANGYVVVMINPRGSTGYGQAFVEGVSGDWGGKPYTDLMTGLDYAEKQFPFIDKTRECALGASYGGFMANWILGHTDRFKCIVSHDGVFDAESAFGTTEEDWFNIWEFKGHPWDYYGKPDAENPFRKFSPSLYAKNFKTPTLVIHSQLDYRLDVSEGFQLFDTLQLLKVPSKMLYFPDESHFVQKPQNSQLWYKTVNDWVDEWTGKSRE
jgi:dipeptidyl aminopeptidase/acylaminoacyl peptidase